MNPAILATILLLVAAPAFAQVAARQAEPSEVQGEPSVEVADPMLLDIPMTGKGKPLSDPSVSGRTYYGVKQYVCDKARVTKITVTKKPTRTGWDLEVTPTVTTEWPPSGHRPEGGDRLRRQGDSVQDLGRLDRGRR